MIKAIETRYKGYRFRSRLEARWAVFFDEMGLAWEYEPEGFDLREHGWYLPDFKVETPDGSPVWYEVKPKGSKDDGKISKFLTGINLMEEGAPFIARGGLLSGDPVDFFHINTKTKRSESKKGCPRCFDITVKAEELCPNDEEYAFLCYACDQETLGGGGNPTEFGFMECPFQPYKGWVTTDRDWYGLLVSRKIERAAIKARSARFEHGETP